MESLGNDLGLSFLKYTIILDSLKNELDQNKGMLVPLNFNNL